MLSLKYLCTKESSLLTTQYFYIAVQRSAVSDDEITSTNEYKALVEALNEASKAVDIASAAASKANSAADNADTARESLTGAVNTVIVTANAAATAANAAAAEAEKAVKDIYHDKNFFTISKQR